MEHSRISHVYLPCEDTATPSVLMGTCTSGRRGGDADKSAQPPPRLIREIFPDCVVWLISPTILFPPTNEKRFISQSVRILTPRLGRVDGFLGGVCLGIHSSGSSPPSGAAGDKKQAKPFVTRFPPHESKDVEHRALSAPQGESTRRPQTSTASFPSRMYHPP